MCRTNSILIALKATKFTCGYEIPYPCSSILDIDCNLGACLCECRVLDVLTMNFQFRYKYIEINFNENLNPITLAKYCCCHVVLRSTNPHATGTHTLYLEYCSVHLSAAAAHSGNIFLVFFWLFSNTPEDGSVGEKWAQFSFSAQMEFDV